MKSQTKSDKLKSRRHSSISAPKKAQRSSVSTPKKTLKLEREKNKFCLNINEARNRKFHKIFKQVPTDEKILNYFSCALLTDILLQGHLYVTNNYFGFYSNVFGHITKILIPLENVLNISKERTAKIIPNAVGIETEGKKYVFGSLLSRSTTFLLMTTVWDEFKETANTDLEFVSNDNNTEIYFSPLIIMHEDADDTDLSVCSKDLDLELKVSENLKVFKSFPLKKIQNFTSKLLDLSQFVILLYITTGLLVILLFSAAILIYRANYLFDKIALCNGKDEMDLKFYFFQDFLSVQYELRDNYTTVQTSLMLKMQRLIEAHRSLQTLFLDIRK